ncbi:Muniscin C-terminal mu homology domain-containing protein [Xylaria arbuscula]|nr:Muniscin C-terminal mu homology domain-containing protein [Xylaria arbuscula]
MDDLSRPEYPALLDCLQPGQAVTVLTDRVKRITKVNNEIADWLQERRRVEEQYAQGLRRLAQFRVPNAQSELGSFQVQWDKILQSAEVIATSHHTFAAHIEKDVETPLRMFEVKKEMQNIQTIQGNLQKVARELEEAQEKSDKLTKKGGKASAQKVDLAASKLESATNQWKSQAPFVFESLQAVDESRMNQLRDCLTQYGTLEGEQAQRLQTDAESVLNSLLDYSTATEIQQFVSKVTMGRPKLEKRATTTRQSSSAGGTITPGGTVPGVNAPTEDDRSDYSGPKEGPPENKLRSRIGTMLGRRRQSIHGGFGQLAPSKSPFGRNTKSSHGLSPRASSSNLGDSPSRLGALAEDPDSATNETFRTSEASREKVSHDGPNGVGRVDSTDVVRPTTGTTTTSQVNGTGNALDVSDVPPPPGPPPSQKEPEKDAEGFSVPSYSHDPISQAEKEAAAQESEHAFKLNIQKEPVAEEDEDAKKAALSNVANSLSAMGAPTRKMGTVRGRRDVRSTIYVPGPVSENSVTSTIAPPLPTIFSRPTGLSTLASEASIAGTSDTQSIRSSNSLSSVVQAKHPEMHEPGLNSSLIETVSATFESGAVKSVKVNGEIALSFNPGNDPNPPSHISVRINNFSHLESIGPNRIFVSNSPDHPDQFTMDTSHLRNTHIGFSYKLHSDVIAPPTEHVPILLHPTWKPQGDKLGLLLQYKLNPSFNFASSSPVQLHNLVIFATYEGSASGVQTKPSGTHLKEKHLVYWRLGDVTLSSDRDWQKIVCRVVGEQGAEPKPGNIEARWEFNPLADAEAGRAISLSKLEEGKGKEVEITDDDPFADATSSTADGKWVDVPAVRRILSGRYEAKPAP